MNTPAAAAFERPLQALLDLVEGEREGQCGALLAQAQQRAAALHEQVHGEARARMRQAFAEQRQRHAEAIAAAQARLATHRRLHEQQRTAALLALGWQGLPAELLALWQDAATRSDWVRATLAAARHRLPRGAWRVLHPPGWDAGECAAQAAALAAEGIASGFEADAAIAAGIKVIADGNVVDGTLGGLLADRDEIEARLLRLLEGAS